MPHTHGISKNAAKTRSKSGRRAAPVTGNGWSRTGRTAGTSSNGNSSPAAAGGGAGGRSSGGGGKAGGSIGGARCGRRADDWSLTAGRAGGKPHGRRGGRLA